MRIIERIDRYLASRLQESVDPAITYTSHDIAGHVSPADERITSAAKAFLRGQPHMGEWADEHQHFVVAHHPEHGVVGVAAAKDAGGSTVEVGYAVHPAFRRQGLASSLLRKSEEANAAYSGVDRFYADAVNPASAAVLTKAGYTTKDGRSFYKDAR